MAEQHRRRHKAHLDQHVKDANGEYHYIGDWYAVSGGFKALLPFALRSLLAAAAAVAAGCLRFEGLQNTWYVILPYVAVIGLSIALLWQGGKLAANGGRIKTFDYEKTSEAIPPIAGALSIAALLTASLGAVSLISHGAEAPLPCALFFALLLIAAISAWMARKAYQKQVWEKQ